MSSMAGEIAARMAEDGVNPRESFSPGAEAGPVPAVDVPPTEAPGASVPGNEGGISTPTPPAPPSAGTQITDTPADGPGPVPYARFKEVNDQLVSLKGYSELASYGYDPDSLGRLAAFEAQYVQDPTGTIGLLVDDLDLPQEAKASIKEALAMPTGQSEEPVEEELATASLSSEDRELLDWARGARERESQAASEAQLDSVVNAWKALDKEEAVRTPPDHRVLTFISAAAARGGFNSLTELAVNARNDYLEERGEILGGAYQGSRSRGTPPPALPGSGALPASPQTPKTLREASRLAQAAMERGELPPLDMGG